MTRIFPLAFLLAACNADRPQVLDVGQDQEVVSLTNGGALLLRRAIAEREPEQPTCYVRMRGVAGFAPMPCELARTVRP